MAGPSRKGVPRGRGKVMSEAAFARLWADDTVTINEIAARLGVCRQAVSIRAAVRGLPPRKGRYKRPRVEDQHPDIAPMWRANVGLRDMAAHFGCSHTAIIKAADRLGLPKRSGTRWDMISVEDYLALRLRIAMAASARETAAVLKNSQMVDRIIGSHKDRAAARERLAA